MGFSAPPPICHCPYGEESPFALRSWICSICCAIKSLLASRSISPRRVSMASRRRHQQTETRPNHRWDRRRSAPSRLSPCHRLRSAPSNGQSPGGGASRPLLITLTVVPLRGSRILLHAAVLDGRGAEVHARLHLDAIDLEALLGLEVHALLTLEEAVLDRVDLGRISEEVPGGEAAVVEARFHNRDQTAHPLRKDLGLIRGSDVDRIDQLEEVAFQRRRNRNVPRDQVKVSAGGPLLHAHLRPRL